MTTMGPAAGGNSTKSGVLERTITIIELIAAHESGIGVREAARLTGIDRSAVSRILTELETLAYVEQDRDRGVYSAGPRLFSIVATLAERDSVARAARPVLSDLVSRFNETCFAFALVDDRMVLRARVDSDHTVRAMIELGSSSTLVTTAAGLAILSGLPTPERERLLVQRGVETSPLNNEDLDSLRQLLEEDRERGYSYSAGNVASEGADIAAPYFDAAGNCAGSISLGGPRNRVESLPVDSAGAAVQDAARRMSERLGNLDTRR